MNYHDFLNSKTQHAPDAGFEPLWLPDCLFDFQTYLAEWAIRKGRGAIFADCGLGKSLIQLVWAENVVRKTNKPVLILTPLAVSQQTVKEAEKFGMECRRSQDGKHDGKGIWVTNYERLQNFDCTDFAGVVCDESSILKSYTGVTRNHITRFMNKMPYRLLCTATAAPNDYVELGTSSEALGELSNSDMLKRFFRQLDDKGQKKESRDQLDAESLIAADPNYYRKLSFRVAQSIGQWRLKHHAIDHFWRWVASWAMACRMPSDLGFDDAKFILPPLNEQDHIIKVSSPPPGMLFNLPAVGLREERAERRRTLTERCEFIASLVDHDRPAVIWCHYNPEGDLLEEVVPHSIQVAGRHSDEYRIAVAEWFIGDKCLCNDSLFRAKLATWPKQQSDLTDTGRSTIESIVLNALKNPSNTDAKTEKNASSTCPSTTKRIKEITCLQKNRSQSGNESGESNTPPTKTSGTRKNKRLKNTERKILTSTSREQCGDTDQLLKSTFGWSNWDVLSAERKSLAIQEVIDCILTTITTPDNSVAFSAVNAILGSDNLTTIQNALKQQQCICGHQSGNRKLITKSKIFGWGLNWQHCNHVVSCASHSYEQTYQSVRRCWRFGQLNPVTHDVVATEGEVRVLANMRRKAQQAEVMWKSIVKGMANAKRIERTNIYTEKITTPSWL